MLNKISYLGHELVKSSFSLEKDPQGKGYYKYNVSVAENEFSFSEVHDNNHGHSHNELSMVLNTFVYGYEKKSEDPVFKLDIKFIIRFELNKSDVIEQDYALDNEWFFINFASIASKEIIDSILSHTALKNTFIPSYRTSAE
jgi:hypothetical protein